MKRKLAVAAGALASASLDLPKSCSTREQPRMPPLTAQTMPVPAQAMQVKNPRRSTPSLLGSCTMRSFISFSFGKSYLNGDRHLLRPFGPLGRRHASDNFEFPVRDWLEHNHAGLAHLP